MTSHIRTYQWILIITATVVFLVWELAVHRWMMQLPMPTYHLVSALGAAVWLALVASTIFNILARHERELQRLNAELAQKNESLRQLEARRDDRLVELSQNLSLSLAELMSEAEFGLQRTTDLPNIKALSSALDQARKMFDVARALLDLKQTQGVPIAAICTDQEGEQHEGPGTQ